MSLSRWLCPTCGDGKLAPRRPRKDDVRRYCLACSETTGRLVERTNPVIEKKRAASKERSKKKARARYAFRAPEGYYLLDCMHIQTEWGRLGFSRAAELRVRTTRAAGPAAIRGHVVTFRRFRGLDRWDACAQILVAGARFALTQAGRSTTDAYAHSYIRSLVESLRGVRPRLNRLAEAEIEVAALLRAKDAVSHLGHTLERATA
jgi:hypothetical protein